MFGFHVAPPELRQAAKIVHGLAREFAEQPARKYWADPEQAGNDELAAALALFQNTARDTADLLDADLAGMVTGLADTAAAYERSDATGERLLRALRSR
ncbi:hypothetical protein [Goodfellowiella coeruleoviolacea]|uniref:Uncharacterized protein n=1 Tax=Goodfellowiella coeruleoviolacea TaxID=334858 RepID=A0AAE3KF51_9PSEU|nr:hypothetical protein [Goodfellowiella coeruleoviolacea]MCP2164587.1 hypothetical protein [Goodfellowiella coeruleoviolacea]